MIPSDDEIEIIEYDNENTQALLYEHENRISYLEDQFETLFRTFMRVLMYFPVEPDLIPDFGSENESFSLSF